MQLLSRNLSEKLPKRELTINYHVVSKTSRRPVFTDRPTGVFYYHVRTWIEKSDIITLHPPFSSITFAEKNEQP